MVRLFIAMLALCIASVGVGAGAAYFLQAIGMMP